MDTLRPGQRLRSLASPLPVVVEEAIGEGGQGSTHFARFDGRRFALKWYHDTVLRVDRGLAQRLRVAIDRGAPSSQFLWPFDLVTRADGSGLGYLMRVRTAGYEKVVQLLDGKVQPSFRVLATLCCTLTDALYALHAKGLAYQDLNAGNVFFDPATGDTEICDNDNVDIDGAPSVMGGVWEFQAPEIVLRQAGPSRATDLHSLAVMLFRILLLGHPLVGRRELQHANLGSEQAMRRLYGSEARFVFDPVDDSNRPLPELHGPVLGHWPIYPQFIRDLFTRAFTEGLFDPTHGRVQETEWRRATAQLRDAVYTCTRCGAGNFYDARRLAAREPEFACWSCGAPMPSAPLRLGIARAGARAGEPPAHVVVLEPGARLDGHHVGGTLDVARPLGFVEAGPPLVLRNRSTEPWTATRDGERRVVAPGDALALEPGMRIALGRVEATVRA
ncbi:MAG: serine/threonine protein kinase [Proteobacteria bacterium]|nr:serine/threonine protein kinase [Pseudomonadota bacterium]